MKKSLSILLAVLLVFSFVLTGCNDGGQPKVADTATAVVEKVEEKVEEVSTAVSETVETVADKVEETVAEAQTAVEEAVETAADKVEEAADEAQTAVEEAVETAADKVEETAADVQTAVEEQVEEQAETVAEAVSEPEEIWHLGILVHSLDNEFWAQEAKGGELFADSKDDVVGQVLATDGDDNKEMQAMRDFIAQYGDHSIFVTDPASKANTANVVEIAEEAGAKVAILWHHADELEPAEWDSFVVHMSPDDYVAGYNTAKYLFEKMGGKGNVVALYGQQGEDSAANRYAGFLGALAEYPEIECLDMQVASWSQDQAMTFTQTWLSTYDNIDAIWAANDTMGLGAIEALKLEGKNGKILVCGCDGIAAAYEAIEAGDMACTIANNGYLLMGYGASYAYQAAKNGLEVENPVIKTQAVLVTAENVAEYKAMFIDGTPEYDFDDLSFCVLSEHPSFEELNASAEAAAEVVEETVDYAETVVEEASEAIEETVADTEDVVEEAAADVEETVDYAEAVVDEASEAVEETVSDTEAVVEEAAASVEEILADTAAAVAVGTAEDAEAAVDEASEAVEEIVSDTEAAVEEAAADVEEIAADAEAAVEEAAADVEETVSDTHAAVEEASADVEEIISDTKADVEEAVAAAEEIIADEPEEIWHLGILVHSLDNEFWAQEAKGGELFADSKEDVVGQVLATDGDDNKEMQAMRDFIAQYGDHTIFVTDPASKANTANVVEIAEEAGSKVAILWHHADELEPAEWDSFVVHMSPDDYVAGYNTAKYLFDKMGGKGKVCALYGQQGEDSAANRYAGFLGALAEYPEIEMLDMQVASWSQDQAMTFTQTWLSKYDNIDAIWAANDTMGLGAIEALKLEGKNGKILVCGCDGIAAAYEAIEAGDMACTVANNGYLLMGYGASYAYQAAKNGLVVENPVIKTQAVLVTTENVAEYKAMFIDGTPEYDFDDLSFCVLSEHPSFAELAAETEAPAEEPVEEVVVEEIVAEEIEAEEIAQ